MPFALGSSIYTIAAEGRLILHSNPRARASKLCYQQNDSQQVLMCTAVCSCLTPLGSFLSVVCICDMRVGKVSLEHRGSILVHTPVHEDDGLRAVQIWEWVKAFCEKTNATGQLCFDFMHNDEDGRMYAFECNPRTSTIFLNFYNHDHVVQAFFNAQVCAI